MYLESCDWSDMTKLKTYCLIDNFDKKSKKVQINDFLIKFAKIELEKFGLLIEKEINGESIKFTLLKKENKMLSFNSTEKKPKIISQRQQFSEIKEENSFVFSTEKKSQPKEGDNSKSILDQYKDFISNHKFNEDIILYIDNREGRQNKETGLFYEKLIEFGVNCEQKALSVGDFVWVYRDPSSMTEYILDYIIERKSIDDLAHSIIDGRYDEQKYRLKNCGVQNVYYLFEGSSISNNQYINIQKSAIQTAIFHTINIHDINIFPCVFLHLTHPVLNLLKTFSISNIIDHDHSITIFIKVPCK